MKKQIKHIINISFALPLNDVAYVRKTNLMKSITKYTNLL